MNALLTLDLETYNQFIIVWGLLGLISALSLYYLKLMPISSRVESSEMSILGDIDKRTGWIIMEVPILISVIYFYWASNGIFNASIVFVGIFIFHYFHRALIFPYRIKVKGKTMPVMSMFLSMIFYIVNGYLIGYYFGALKTYSWTWLLSPQFIIGFFLFVVGFVINVTSDNILINLRKPGESAYKIPHGKLYQFISCPNYFGEIIEWVGFAIMCWCLPATVYMLWVALPLMAQGLQAHKWYLDKFKTEYPSDRKAIIPFVV